MPDRQPDLGVLLNAGRLHRQDPDRNLLAEMIELAERDLDAAAANRDQFAPWAEAML